MSQNSFQKDLILEALDYYRGIILDAVEQEFGHSESWPRVRSRLLKALGDRGLSNRIQIILEGSKK